MQGNQPSFTAQGAAEHRAAHQVLEKGAIFTDPFAARILGEDAQAIADRHEAEPGKRPMRLFVSARSRFAEDALARATARGTRQAVVLGAGFDTFAIRNPHAQIGLRVFEVDHPSTQAWKRGRLIETGIPIPSTLTFVPVDFERESLPQKLNEFGFDPNRPAFFMWLGVVPYLTVDAIKSVLQFVGSLPTSEIVFDYPEPRANIPAEHHAQLDALHERVAKVGEPLITSFDPSELKEILSSAGFNEIDDVSIVKIICDYLGVENKSKSSGVAHMICARKLCGP